MSEKRYFSSSNDDTTDTDAEVSLKSYDYTEKYLRSQVR